MTHSWSRSMISLLWVIQIVSWTQLQFYSSGYAMFSYALAEMHGVFELFAVRLPHHLGSFTGFLFWVFGAVPDGLCAQGIFRVGKLISGCLRHPPAEEGQNSDVVVAGKRGALFVGVDGRRAFRDAVIFAVCQDHLRQQYEAFWLTLKLMSSSGILLLGVGSLRALRYIWNIFGWMFIGFVVATFVFYSARAIKRTL